MDSLARVELLGVIEEELGTFIDDATWIRRRRFPADGDGREAAREAKHDTGI